MARKAKDDDGKFMVKPSATRCTDGAVSGSSGMFSSARAAVCVCAGLDCLCLYNVHPREGYVCGGEGACSAASWQVLAEENPNMCIPSAFTPSASLARNANGECVLLLLLGYVVPLVSIALGAASINILSTQFPRRISEWMVFAIVLFPSPFPCTVHCCEMVL